MKVAQDRWNLETPRTIALACNGQQDEAAGGGECRSAPLPCRPCLSRRPCGVIPAAALPTWQVRGRAQQRGQVPRVSDGHLQCRAGCRILHCMSGRNQHRGTRRRHKRRCMPFDRNIQPRQPSSVSVARGRGRNQMVGACVAKCVLRRAHAVIAIMSDISDMAVGGICRLGSVLSRDDAPAELHA